MKSLATAKLKRVRALELLAQGMSYDAVARAVGYKHRGSAHRAVFQALAEREADGIDMLRALELARLDALQSAVWGKAMQGDIASANFILKVFDRRSRLFGLDRRYDDNNGGAGLTHLVVGPPKGNTGDATARD